jgi:hypothetical protein
MIIEIYKYPARREEARERGAWDQSSNPGKAIQMLEGATPNELGNPVPSLAFGGTLYPVYLRGQVYLLLRQGSAAGAEFQKYVDHRSVVNSYPLGALARLGLARACALQGDTAKAREVPPFAVPIAV